MGRREGREATVFIALAASLQGCLCPQPVIAPLQVTDSKDLPHSRSGNSSLPSTFRSQHSNVSTSMKS